MEVRTIEARVHGRLLYQRRSDARLLVGFHGYAENAEIHMAELEKIPGIERWSTIGIQALHPFYARGGQEVVASWMTRLDRELAIADNIAYVKKAIDAIPRATLVFAGFSQGVAMAYRAAASIPSAGVIVLAGDVPPDVDGSRLPPVLIGRGRRDDRYTTERLVADRKLLREAEVCEFEGGHEWTDEFRAAAGRFLTRCEGA